MRIDPEHTSSGDLYRLLISTVLPRPIAWVSTHSLSGVVNVAPFSYFQAVGASPPMITLSIGQRIWGGQRVDKDSLRNIRDTGEFVVNIATEADLDAVNQSSMECPPDESEARILSLDTAPGERVAPPRLSRSPVHFECKLERIVKLGRDGRMSLVIGEVVLFHVKDRVWDPDTGAVDPVKLRPLARLGGRMYAGLGDIFTRQRPEWPPG